MTVDYPRAWEISRMVPIVEHHDMCSYRQTGGVLLCDCNVLMDNPEVTDGIMQTAGGAVYQICEADDANS
jgi:hypothetical protein